MAMTGGEGFRKEGKEGKKQKEVAHTKLPAGQFFPFFFLRSTNGTW